MVVKNYSIPIIGGHVFNDFFWLLLSLASIFTVSSRFMDASLLPKWYATEVVLIVGGLLSVLLHDYEKVYNKSICYLHICRIMNILTFVEALLSIGQKTHLINYFSGCTVGTFDNLAGFTTCMSLSFPLGFSFYMTYGKTEKLFFVLMKSVSLLAILMNVARIGVICMLLVLIIIICKKKLTAITVSSLFLIISIPICALLLKTDSTSGRWFIIDRTINMIKEHPFKGWGHNGFIIHYMNEQGKYFSFHPNSHYAFFADNIHHPFNEYLLLTVNYGLPILIIPFFCLVFIVKYYLKNKSEYSKEGMAIIVCILFLSAFSYPFSYPQTWVMISLAFLLIFSNSIYIQIIYNTIKRLKWLIVFLLILCSCLLSNKVSSQLAWRKASDMIHYNSTKATAIYSELFNSMDNDYAFLYNYGSELYFNGECRLAEQFAEKATHYISDYNLQLLLGDIYGSLGKYQDAINAYQIASNMCPSRIVPLYETYKIYRLQNDSANCVSTYKKMVNTKYKRMSTDVLKMLHEVENDCKRFII